MCFVCVCVCVGGGVGGYICVYGWGVLEGWECIGRRERRETTQLYHIVTFSSLVQPLAEFKSLLIDTKSNTKNITKSISIHSDYHGVHFW